MTSLSPSLVSLISTTSSLAVWNFRTFTIPDKFEITDCFLVERVLDVTSLSHFYYLISCFLEFKDIFLPDKFEITDCFLVERVLHVTSLSHFYHLISSFLEFKDIFLPDKFE